MNAVNQQAYAVALTLVAREIEARANRRRFEAAHDAWRKLIGLPPTITLKSGSRVFEVRDGEILLGKEAE